MTHSSSLITEVLGRLDQFTEEELLHLNRLIVERLKVMQQLRAHGAMIQFRIGQTVTFPDSRGHPITGILTKYNRKSVTVVTHEGGHWNVSPSLLKPSK
jgi:hypothetical protein